MVRHNLYSNSLVLVILLVLLLVILLVSQVVRVVTINRGSAEAVYTCRGIAMTISQVKLRECTTSGQLI